VVYGEHFGWVDLDKLPDQLVLAVKDARVESLYMTMIWGKTGFGELAHNLKLLLFKLLPNWPSRCLPSTRSDR
jgi:hypothetical protein